MRCAAAAIIVLLGTGCRGGATRVIYAGPPIGSCAAGRTYPVPPVDAPTQELIPIVAEAPISKPEPAPEPSVEDAVEPEKPAKPSKSKKDKPPKPSKRKDRKP